LQVYAPPEKGSQVIGFIPEQKSIYTIDVGTSCINDCTDAVPSGTKISAAQGVAVSDRAGAAGAVTAGTRAHAPSSKCPRLWAASSKPAEVRCQWRRGR
jgi:filamentous hemagglutinin